MTEQEYVKARVDRILTRVSELRAMYPDVSVELCLKDAIWLEAVLYGSFNAEQPIGIVGQSPLHALRQAHSDEPARSF